MSVKTMGFRLPSTAFSEREHTAVVTIFIDRPVQTRIIL